MTNSSNTCPSCGSLVSEGDKFCPSCGKPLPQSDAVSKPLTPEFVAQHARQSAQPQQRSTITTRPQVIRREERYDDYRVMGAYSKSFTTPAIITLVLYIFLWVPGFIANVIYLNEANKVESITGEKPEGKGCLVAMLVMMLLVILGICVFWMAVAGALTS